MNVSKQSVRVALFIALILPTMISCGGSGSSPAEGSMVANIPISISKDDLQASIRVYAQVPISYDESVLSEPETQALAKLVEAGYIMDEIFLRQVWSGNVALREDLRKADAAPRASAVS